MKREDLSIGQLVWVSGWNGNGPMQRETVTKVGRLNVTIGGHQYRIADQKLISQYSGRFETEPQRAEKARRTIAVSHIRQHGLEIYRESHAGWSIAQLVALTDWLDRNHPA